MSQQQEKQKITIHIETEYDQEIAQEEYDRLLSERNNYINKGFSESQAKYFNRRNEDIMREFENGWLDCLIIKAIAKDVNLPCGHTYDFWDSIGGCFVRNRQDTLDRVKDYQLIENVKEQIIKEGINAEFEINEDLE